MKGDFTRMTFDPAHRFSRVLMQQGRVQMDADHNEQADIHLHLLRTFIADMIGPYAAPHIGGGFELTKQNAGDFLVSKGRFYVDGILVEQVEDDLKWRTNAAEPYFVYLEVWERHMNHIQASHILDDALEGTDTCTRAQVAYAIAAEEWDGGGDLKSALIEKVNELRDEELARAPLMQARVSEEGAASNACSIAPSSRYRGHENQLYRVEVHREGVLWDGKTNNGKPAGNFPEAATFKWSRDNGSIVGRVFKQRDRVIHLESLGRDERMSFHEGDWVEVIDDEATWDINPGALAMVEAVDPAEMTVRLGTIYASENKVLANASVVMLRRWDHQQQEGVYLHEGAVLIPGPSDGGSSWVHLEDGIEVAFTKTGHRFHTGDYWHIPARVAKGSIDWPKEGKEWAALPPRGIFRHRAPLAVVSGGNVENFRTFMGPDPKA
jgi:hypothetical protein